MNSINGTLRSINRIGEQDYRNMRNLLENAEKEYLRSKLICLFGTLGIVFLCFCVFYIRFRVFGG